MSQENVSRNRKLVRDRKKFLSNPKWKKGMLKNIAAETGLSIPVVSKIFKRDRDKY